MQNCNEAATPAEANFKLLFETGDEEVVDATLYKQILGSLRYLCNSRLDIGFAVRMASRIMSDPRISHFAAMKRISLHSKCIQF